MLNFTVYLEMESNSCTKVCRLCLDMKSNFEIIEEVTLANLDYLWLKLNLTISEEPVMCGDCAVTIAISLDFKTKCLEIENCIVSFAKDEYSIKIDLRDVYMSKMSVENIVNVPEDHIVCRFCLILAKNDSAIFLKNSTDIVEKLEQYFPELNLTCTDDPAICASCQVSLQCYFSFINTCLTTEEKITEYCKIDGINSMGQIDLNSVKHFISKDFLKCKVEVGTVKIEGMCNEVSKSANNVEIKKEDILDMDIKEDNFAQESEVIDENSFHHTSSLLSDCVPQRTRAKPAKYTCEICGYQNNRRYRVKEHMQKHTNTMDLVTRGPMHKCYHCEYETKWKFYLRSHMLTHKSPSEITMYKCETCTFETKYRSNLQTHKLIHMDVSEIEMYKCEVCHFKTKRKKTLQKHILSHRNTPDVVTPGTMYKCDLCDYETKWKGNLQTHMVIHKTPSEIIMYKCAMCTYETRHKGCLRTHIMLIHRDLSEIEMHKCEVCPFKTKRKGVLQKHLLSHRNTPAVVTPGTMYKCALCDYETKWKACLKRHMLTHKTPSEIIMYKCETCTYETKDKYYLQRHMLIHMDMSEIEMYKCEVCPFKTKRKGTLQKHLRSQKHSTPDVVTPGTMYKCDLCDYETKWKVCLKRHMLTHKTPSEITMYKCETCTYESKYKYYLQRHMLIHMDVSEIEMYKCGVCHFETKRKNSLRNHMLSHRIPRGTMYKCYHCDYKTKWRLQLKRHIQTHKTHSEITMYKCEARGYAHLQRHTMTHMDESKNEMHKCKLCPYETKWGRYIRLHMFFHRNPSDVK